MPLEMERIKDLIWKSIRGKRNPRTNKPYTESDAYAIAQTIYKKKQKGGK